MYPRLTSSRTPLRIVTVLRIPEIRDMALYPGKQVPVAPAYLHKAKYTLFAMALRASSSRGAMGTREKPISLILLLPHPLPPFGYYCL